MIKYIIYKGVLHIVPTTMSCYEYVVRTLMDFYSIDSTGNISFNEYGIPTCDDLSNNDISNALNIKSRGDEDTKIVKETFGITTNITEDTIKDANRLNKLLNCGRIRLLGWAGGTDDDKTISHIGCELWRTFPTDKHPSVLDKNKLGRQMLLQFIDNI